MEDGAGPAGHLDEQLLAPVLALLDDADEATRIEAFGALIALPLTEQAWRLVAGYANRTLLGAAGQSDEERCAVVAAMPWIPLRSVRDLVGRIADGRLGSAGHVQDAALRAVATAAQPDGDTDRNPSDGAGFTPVSEDEREQFLQLHAGRSADDIRVELRGDVAVPDAQRALLVTASMARAAEALDVASGYEIARSIEGGASVFRPDLHGLFGVFAAVHAAPPPAARFIAWQIAWLVSRGGLRGVVAGLDAALRSADREERSAALLLIQFAAAFAGRAQAPSEGVGVGVDPVDPRPGVMRPAALIDDVPHGDEAAQLDDDVQFTVYRPTRVQPGRWYPFLAFAHRTDQVEGAGGAVIDPVEEVARQAAAVLGGAGSFESLRADSDVGLVRGSDLLFEPWIDAGEFNPTNASVRWEEPVHRVEFRLRVPSDADGRRLRGGVRVFVGALLIGEVRFQLPVSAGAAGVEENARDTAKRFRQIFASYSHRDADVVAQVEQYVSVTGDRYMIDVRTLRSGEQWDERLRELIDEADIFQLFWSRNAMRSQYVRNEWEYALQLGREGFVRPVYWDDPLPEDRANDLPPSRLKELHFSRLATATATVPPAAILPAMPPPSMPPPSMPPPSRPASAVRPPAAPPRRPRRRTWVIAAVIVVAVVLGLVLFA